MRYYVLATDYDGTLAKDGKVNDDTLKALKQVKKSGRKIILVTGREMKELEMVFPEYGVFDLIVAENGALILNPENQQEILLGSRPPDNFIDELKNKNVFPLSVGKIIVATWEPHENTVLKAIKNAGIEHQVIFNKGAVMVLPPGINKAKGLTEALNHLRMSMHNIVAIGDAENYNAMLQAAECPVAVANALDSVKEQAAFVTTADHGEGVSELINHLIENDLAAADRNLKKQYLSIGKMQNEQEYAISPYKDGVLLAGSSGGGKSTLTTAFLESLKEKQYQFCLIDPEGDYAEVEEAVIVGTAEQPPVTEEIMNLLLDPAKNVIICLLAIDIDKRPAFFNELFPKIVELRKSKGHPHWMIIDEINHMLSVEKETSFYNVPQELNNLWLITTDPGNVNKAVIRLVNTIIAVGDEPLKSLQDFAASKEIFLPQLNFTSINKGQALVWDTSLKQQPQIITTNKPKQLNRRHIKKYATGFMDYNSFYFTGAKHKLNLKAYNVMVFSQLAEGIDDETWIYHLKRNDYSRWFRNSLHDNDMADMTQKIENSDGDVLTSKAEILKLIRKRYTEPG